MAVGGLVLSVVLMEIAISDPMKQRLFFMSEGARAVFHTPTPITDFLSKRHERVWIHSLGLNPTFPQKVASVYRFRGIADYEPATLLRHAEYFRYLAEGPKGLERKRVPYSGGVSIGASRRDPDALLKRRRLLDVAAARYILADYNLARNTRLESYIRERGIRFVSKDQRGTLLENPNALPRAVLTYHVAAAPDTPELLELMSRDEFDPRRLSYVEGDPGFEESPNAPPKGKSATFRIDEATTVEVIAKFEAPGMLVLADTFQSGWRATVDGVEVPIRRTNHLFRGVPASAGRHLIRFEYHPRSFYRGLAATSLGLVVLLVLTVWEPLRRRMRPSPPARVHA